MAATKSPVIPGFKPALGVTLFALGLIVLLPIIARGGGAWSLDRLLGLEASSKDYAA